MPIQADKYNILLDNVTGKSIIQIKFRNISQKTVKSISIDIECFDAAKDSLGFIKDVSYMENAEINSTFGDRQPINTDKTNIGNISIIVTKAVFDDETVWRNENNEPLTEFKQQNARDYYGDLYEQYERECNENNYKSTYAFENKGDYWICSCGQPNNIANTNCCYCDEDINILTSISNEEYLKEAKEKYEEAERIKREEIAAKAEKEAAKIAKNEEKIRKFSLITTAVVLIMVTIGFCINYGMKIYTYSKANELLENGDYINTGKKFVETNSFKDSDKKIQGIIHLLQENASKFEKKLSTSIAHTVGLKSDGTAIAVGANEYGDCDVSDWNYITDVSVGDLHSVGLKSDGTVVVVGYNEYGQCNISNWKDIVAISAGSYHTVGLKSDGTVVAIGNNENGQCDISAWKDIIAVSAGYSHTVGLKSDGTVVAVGWNEYGQCDVSGWNNIVAVSAELCHTVGLKSDGTVVAVGLNEDGQCDVSNWKNIVAVSAGSYHTVGLKADGTVVAIGYNEYGQCDVSDWKDIVAVSAGDSHTVGLKSDGTVVAVGNNEYGQCNVSDWKDIGK